MPSHHRLGCLWFIVLLAVTTAGRGEEAAKQTPTATLPETNPAIEKAPLAYDGDKLRQGPRIEKHPNGRPKILANYRNGLLHGTYSEYAENGRAILKAKYTDGRLDGDWAQWTEKSELVRSARYANGKLHGIEKKYVDGKLNGEWVWEDGEFNGPTAPWIKAKLGELAKAEVKGPGGDDKKAGMRRLMMYRFLCNMPYDDLVLDETMNAEAGAAAMVCDKLGKITHDLTVNPGVPDTVFELAKRGAAKSNLNMHAKDIADAIDSFIADSDGANIELVGHRRWCLCSSLLKVGLARSGSVSAMWTLDRSRSKIPDWQYVAFPPRGLMPKDMFGEQHPWSVTPNPEHFQTPAKEQISVRIWRIPRNVKVNLNNLNNQSAMKLEFLTVSDAKTGDGACLIFRPTGVTLESGTKYRVEIQGLTTKDGRSEPLKYGVEFF